MGKLRSLLAMTVVAGCLASLTALPVQASPPSATGPSTGPTDPEVAAADAALVPVTGTPAERLAQLNDMFERASADIEKLNTQLAQDQVREARVTTSLAAIARLQYEQQGPLLRFLSAGSLGQVMGDIAQDKLVAEREAALLHESRALKVRDRRARDLAVSRLAQIRAGRDEAQTIADQAKADEALRAQAQALADAEAETAAAAAAASARQALAGTAATVTRSTQAVPASEPIRATTSGPNRFAYGYCTWYVANRRYIPFLGNAADWWPNARAYGFAEGQAPQVGAVMVTWESGYGHVAYVESVNSDGSWTVSEMNFRGWNVISSRTIHRGQVPLIGFIYGKA